MADEKSIYMEFNEEKQNLMEKKCVLDLKIKMMEDQADRIVSREERILADARHKIEVVSLI